MNKVILIILVSISLFGIEQKQEGVGWLDVFSYNDGSKKPRILIIGDSIVRQYAHLVKEKIKDKYSLTRLSTSKSICSKEFINQLSVAFTQNYDKILINNGLHDFTSSNKQYEKCYIDSLNYIIETNPNSEIMLLTTTGVNGIANREKIVIQRNISLNTLSEKYKLNIIDLYSVVHGKKELWRDAYHFELGGGKSSCKQSSRSYLES